MSITIRQGVTLSPGVSVKVPVYIPQQYTLTLNIVGADGQSTVIGDVLPPKSGSFSTRLSASYLFDEGTMLTLSAIAIPGTVFAGWSGAESGTGSPTIIITADTTVTATFSTI